MDIASCKCVCVSKCYCKRDLKVPQFEIEFLKDQRTVRKMVIGGVDSKATEKIKKKLTRSV